MTADALVVPDHLVCPLSKTPMLTPVLVTSVSKPELAIRVGDTVDQKALLERCDWDFDAACFVPNRAISEALEDFWSSVTAKKTPVNSIKEDDIRLLTAELLDQILKTPTLQPFVKRSKRLASKPSRQSLFSLVAILARHTRPWIREMALQQSKKRHTEKHLTCEAKRPRFASSGSVERDEMVPTEAAEQSQVATATPFTLNIRTITGSTIHLKATLGTTVAELKAIIQEKEGIPPDQIRLIIYGKNMEDLYALGQYSRFKEAPIIHMILRLRGGMHHPSTTGEEPTTKQVSLLGVDDSLLCAVEVDLAPASPASEARMHAAVLRSAVLGLCALPPAFDILCATRPPGRRARSGQGAKAGPDILLRPDSDAPAPAPERIRCFRVKAQEPSV